MKKGQIEEGIVGKLVFPNKGIVVLEGGERVTVKNTIPGQRVRFGINKVRKGKAEGRMLELLEKSPLETEKACVHFGICGGCTYQGLPYEEQLNIKKSQVEEILGEVLVSYASSVSKDWFQGIKGSPEQLAYRNKMEFSFGDEVKDGPIALGMHKRGSFYDVVTVTECQIVDEDYRKILTCVADYFKEREYRFFHKMTHKGYLRHLLVRKAKRTGEILIDLITTTQEKPDLSDFTRVLLALELDGKIVGILNTWNDREADVVQNDETVILYGQDFFYEEILGLRFKISPFSFFQTNSLGAEVLYETAREFVGDTRDKVIFDLYSGTGTIAQMLAPVAKKVIGVEIVEEAVAAAKENADLNHLHNVEFLAGDVLKIIDEIKEKPDLIVLDPPRDGIHPKAISKIIDYGVDRIVYISCKPTSLARDLDIFLQAGYRLEKAVAVDMFPGTGHCESLCLLQKVFVNG